MKLIEIPISEEQLISVLTKLVSEGKILLSEEMLTKQTPPESTFSALAPNEQVRGEIRTNINWIWQAAGDAPPASLKAWTVPVPLGGGLRSIRGPIGATSCGNTAVLFSLAGMEQEALEWLFVAQSHEKGESARAWFSQDPGYTIEYARTTYLKEALIFGGISVGVGGPIPYSYVKGFLEAFKRNHRPDPNPRHLREPREPREPGGRARHTIYIS